MKIGNIELDSPFVVSPMAGMTDTAFRRLVKRQGGCGLVVSEMVSSEGLVRGIDRTLEYAEYTEEERPVSIQIFGGEPAKMAEAARVVEAMGANIVDVNMGCPVAKIAKHNAGCSLMREPHHAAEIIAAMTKAVNIPVTVKMRKGWDDGEVNAPELAKRVEAAGASAIAVHGRTAKQSYSGFADWEVVAGIARSVSIPVFGSGDCIEPEDIVARMKSGVSGVFVGRGVLRNPWILAQARDLMAGRPARQITPEERGQFLLDYMALLLADEKGEQEGFRHLVVQSTPPRAEASKERWVINKLRALCAWYTKGFEGGAQFRIGINSAKSIPEVEGLIEAFFFSGPGTRDPGSAHQVLFSTGSRIPDPGSRIPDPGPRIPIMIPEITIGGRKVGRAHVPLVIAEIGINHEGSLEVAREMVDAAARAGVEVVKHQTHVVEDEMSGAAKQVVPGNASVSIYQIMERCALSEDDERQLKEYVESKGMIFMSTPFSRAAADRLQRMNVAAYKIGSGECNNYPLLKHIAAFGKPTILSTGMNTLESVAKAVAIFEQAGTPCALLHTTNLYPTPPKLVRLGAMVELGKAFPNAVIGLSDHTTDNIACIGAMALGASIVERHFTDHMYRVGPDIVCSMDEAHCRELIEAANTLHAELGGTKGPAKEEQVTMDFAFATVVTIQPIKAGDVFTAQNLWVKRPGTGAIPAERYEEILGKPARRDLPTDTHLAEEDFQ